MHFLLPLCCGRLWILSGPCFGATLTHFGLCPGSVFEQLSHRLAARTAMDCPDFVSNKTHTLWRPRCFCFDLPIVSGLRYRTIFTYFGPRTAVECARSVFSSKTETLWFPMCFYFFANCGQTSLSSNSHTVWPTRTAEECVLISF